MEKQYNNWTPVINSLLETLIKHGFTLHEVDDECDEGAIPVHSLKEAEGLITGVDMSSLYVKHPTVDKTFWLYIVLGNEPYETVADYSHLEGNPILDRAIDEFSDFWVDKPTPKITETEYRKKYNLKPL